MEPMGNSFLHKVSGGFGSGARGMGFNDGQYDYLRVGGFLGFRDTKIYSANASESRNFFKTSCSSEVLWPCCAVRALNP